MIEKHLIVAIDAHRSWITAVLNWGWHCDNRQLPIYLNDEGQEVRYVEDGRLFYRGILRKVIIKRATTVYVYLGDRWKERSRTYTGIADAMAAQWGSTERYTQPDLFAVAYGVS